MKNIRSLIASLVLALGLLASTSVAQATSVASSASGATLWIQPAADTQTNNGFGSYVIASYNINDICPGNPNCDRILRQEFDYSATNFIVTSYWINYNTTSGAVLCSHNTTAKTITCISDDNDVDSGELFVMQVAVNWNTTTGGSGTIYNKSKLYYPGSTTGVWEDTESTYFVINDN